MAGFFLIFSAACFWISEEDHQALLANLGNAVDSGDATDTGDDGETGDSGDSADTGDDCVIEWYRDADGDGAGSYTVTTTACEAPEGFVAYSTDCDDTDRPVNPDATEMCNGYDDNCDGDADENTAIDATLWYVDQDDDGFGEDKTEYAACEATEGDVATGGDCDDGNKNVSPSADELCNLIDDDCDSETDESDALDASIWYVDVDNDGFGADATAYSACEATVGDVGIGGDCNDNDGQESPNADEICDGNDDNCDGYIDEDTAVNAKTWYFDSDGDGFGTEISAYAACSPKSGDVEWSGDCNDFDADEFPGADEICDGNDDNCDGYIDEDTAIDATTWYVDDDGDNFGSPALLRAACLQPEGFVADATDCDDSLAAVNPAATEACNTYDDDCDALIDTDDDTLDASTASIWYYDDDEDGVGDDATTLVSCDAPTGYVATGGDCIDSDPDVTDTLGLVTYVAANGSIVDYTSTFLAGTSSNPVVFSGIEPSGILRVCPGTWYARFDLLNYANTTIRGYGGAENVVIDAAGSGSVVTTGTGSGNIIGVTLTGGNSSTGGGASVTNGGRLTLSDCVVSGNTAVRGGGLYANVASPVLDVTNCTISDNEATYGGGAYIAGGTLFFEDTDIFGNTASTHGGGIMNDNSNRTITFSGGSIYKNSAAYYGGGIYWYGGTVTLTDTEVYENEGQYGGGLWMSEGDINLVGTSITDNQAETGGGIYAVSQFAAVNLAADDVLMSGNVAGRGGAIYHRGGTIVLEQSTLEGNRAMIGGAVSLDPGTFSLSLECIGSSTSAAGIFDNDAVSVGGGVHLVEPATMTSDLCDWDGTGTNSPQDVYGLSASSISFSENYGDDATFTCDAATGCVP